MKREKKTFKEKLKIFLMLILNPKFILCFGLAWIITNGWAAITFFIGSAFEIGWLVALSSMYTAVMLFPFTPDKVITLALAILLLRWIFPKDERTLGVLRNMYKKAKESFAKRKNKSANADTQDTEEINEEETEQ